MYEAYIILYFHLSAKREAEAAADPGPSWVDPATTPAPDPGPSWVDPVTLPPRKSKRVSGTEAEVTPTLPQRVRRSQKDQAGSTPVSSR